MVRSLLGHRSIETTLRHYAGLEGAAAARHYDETLRAAASHGGEPRRAIRRAEPGTRASEAAV